MHDPELFDSLVQLWLEWWLCHKLLKTEACVRASKKNEVSLKCFDFLKTGTDGR